MQMEASPNDAQMTQAGYFQLVLILVCFPLVSPSKSITVSHRLHCKVKDLDFFALEKDSL